MHNVILSLHTQPNDIIGLNLDVAENGDTSSKTTLHDKYYSIN